VASLLTLVVIAAMCAAVLLTSGRTVGAQRAVLGSIDSAGTRTVVARADVAAGVDTTVLDRLRGIGGVEWTAAFGPARDVRNAAFPGGTRVPLRQAWGDDWALLGLDGTPRGDVAYGSPQAMEQLGLTDGAGQIGDPDVGGWSAVGPVPVPDHLAVLEPLLVAPQPPGDPAPVALVVVVAESPDLVAPVAEALTGVLAPTDPTRVTVETSQSLAELRTLVDRQLGAFGRALTLGILALTGLLTAATLHGVVTLRRKDFGRRRALGASRGLVVVLLLTQTGVVAVGGAVLGSAVAVGVLLPSGDPLPGVAYTVAVAVLAVTTALGAALVPATAAARRDPITELRVP